MEGFFAGVFDTLGDVGMNRGVERLLRDASLNKIRALGDCDVFHVLHGVCWLLKLLLNMLELLWLSVVLVLVDTVEMSIVQRDCLGQVGQLGVDDGAWRVH